MKAHTLLDTVTSWLGTPPCAVPLSFCHIVRPYLLDRAGIPSTGTALLFTIPYLMTDDVLKKQRNLSLYAVPRDYHGFVCELESAWHPQLAELFPNNRFALFSDHSPILEVEAAARAGLGVIGDNGLLITPAYGSFVFIAELCTDADYETVTGQAVPVLPVAPPHCEGCGACFEACPARKAGTWMLPCLSALTQKKGVLDNREIEALARHDLVWGCDACQLACPHNRRVIDAGQDTPIPYFREARDIHVDVPSLASMSDEAFAARAYAWRGRAVLERNLKLKEETTL